MVFLLSRQFLSGMVGGSPSLAPNIAVQIYNGKRQHAVFVSRSSAPEETLHNGFLSHDPVFSQNMSFLPYHLATCSSFICSSVKKASPDREYQDNCNNNSLEFVEDTSAMQFRLENNAYYLQKKDIHLDKHQGEEEEELPGFLP